MNKVIDIPLVDTRLLLEECGTTGHHPVRFLCSDDQTYFCKYRLDTGDETELDLLYNEVVGHALLRQMMIPTPDIAFVRIAEDPLAGERMPNNAKYMLPGVVAFGSREVKGDLVDDTLRYPAKPRFKRLVEPEDLVRVALFDLWVANMDRGRPLWDRPGHNFNLLLVPVPGEKPMHRLMPVDHAAILGGELFIRDFRPDNHRIDVDGKLFRTPLFHDLMGHLGAERRNAVVNHFFGTLVPSTSPHALSTTLDAARPYWPYPPDFAARVTDFLWDADRLARVEREARTFFNTLP